jgi:hypothetical protein
VPKKTVGHNHDVQLQRSCLEGSTDVIVTVTLCKLQTPIFQHSHLAPMKIFKHKFSVTQQFDLMHQIFRTESELKSPATTDMFEANSIV